MVIIAALNSKFRTPKMTHTPCTSNLASFFLSYLVNSITSSKYGRRVVLLASFFGANWLIDPHSKCRRLFPRHSFKKWSVIKVPLLLRNSANFIFHSLWDTSFWEHSMIYIVHIFVEYPWKHRCNNNNNKNTNIWRVCQLLDEIYTHIYTLLICWLLLTGSLPTLFTSS